MKSFSSLIIAKIWNKRLRRNYGLVAGLWLVFIALVFGAWLAKLQVDFNAYFLPASPESNLFNSLATTAILFFEGVSIVALTANIKPALSLAVPFGLLLAYYGVCKIAALFGLALDLFYPFFFGAGAYILNFIYNFLSFDAERAKIKKTFQYYLAPQYIDALAEDPASLKLGGEEKELTVFFSDIRSFSSLAEKMSPAELVEFLNEYFSAMTDIIMANQGVIDKYIGDAVMAFWGAPLTDKNHASHALTSAILMKERLKELNQGWQKKGWPEIKIGMGLNSDTMVVGNIGSSQRFNYTVMGDAVNLASRLEGLSKHYGAPLIASEKTLNAATADFCVRFLDKVAVKGKSEPVKIYEVLGPASQAEKFKGLMRISEEALNAYFARDWHEARQRFEQLKKIDANPIFANLFIGRCQEFFNNPPGKDWSGVWQMTEK